MDFRSWFKKKDIESPSKPPGATDEKFKAFAKGKITGDVDIKVKPEGLTLEFATDSTSYRKIYEEYTPDKYQFIPQEGRNPMVLNQIISLTNKYDTGTDVACV